MLWGDIQLINRTTLNHFTFVHQSPIHAIIAQITEEILIPNLYFTLSEVDRCSPDVLVFISHLIGMWVQLAVRSNHSVAVEVII